MDAIKIMQLQYWKDEELECCCPPKNQCSKSKDCNCVTVSMDKLYLKNLNQHNSKK